MKVFIERTKLRQLSLCVWFKIWGANKEKYKFFQYDIASLVTHITFLNTPDAIKAVRFSTDCWGDMFLSTPKWTLKLGTKTRIDTLIHRECISALVHQCISVNASVFQFKFIWINHFFCLSFFFSDNYLSRHFSHILVLVLMVLRRTEIMRLGGESKIPNYFLIAISSGYRMLWKV